MMLIPHPDWSGAQHPGNQAHQTRAYLRARRRGRLTELVHLRKLNIHAPEQAAPYILLDGHKPIRQMNLF